MKFLFIFLSSLIAFQYSFSAEQCRNITLPKLVQINECQKITLLCVTNVECGGDSYQGICLADKNGNCPLTSDCTDQMISTKKGQTDFQLKIAQNLELTKKLTSVESGEIVGNFAQIMSKMGILETPENADFFIKALSERIDQNGINEGLVAPLLQMIDESIMLKNYGATKELLDLLDQANPKISQLILNKLQEENIPLNPTPPINKISDETLQANAENRSIFTDVKFKNYAENFNRAITQIKNSFEKNKENIYLVKDMAGCVACVKGSSFVQDKINSKLNPLIMGVFGGGGMIIGGILGTITGAPAGPLGGIAGGITGGGLGLLVGSYTGYKIIDLKDKAVRVNNCVNCAGRIYQVAQKTMAPTFVVQKLSSSAPKTTGGASTPDQSSEREAVKNRESTRSQDYINHFNQNPSEQTNSSPTISNSNNVDANRPNRQEQVPNTTSDQLRKDQSERDRTQMELLEKRQQDREREEARQRLEQERKQNEQDRLRQEELAQKKREDDELRRAQQERENKEKEKKEAEEKEKKEKEKKSPSIPLAKVVEGDGNDPVTGQPIKEDPVGKEPLPKGVQVIRVVEGDDNDPITGQRTKEDPTGKEPLPNGVQNIRVVEGEGNDPITGQRIKEDLGNKPKNAPPPGSQIMGEKEGIIIGDKNGGILEIDNNKVDPNTFVPRKNQRMNNSFEFKQKIEQPVFNEKDLKGLEKGLRF